MAGDEEREIVYVERESGTIKPILFGALIGLALGFLFAPQSGEETRRTLRRRLRKARALAEEKVGELSDKFGREMTAPVRGRAERREEARTDLERRLSEARVRRRGRAPTDEDEEPVA
jgi:gas vesicle protein